MRRLSRRTALAVLPGIAAGLAGCSSLDVSNPVGGSIEVESIDIEPTGGTIGELIAGLPTGLTITFVNPGGSSITEEVTVTINGEAAETLTVSLDGNGRSDRQLEHTFEETGEHTVTVKEKTKTFVIDIKAELDLEVRAGGQFAADRGETSGVVSAWIYGQNDSDFPIPFAPDVRVDGETAGQLYHSDRGTIGEPFEGGLEPSEHFELVAQKVVEVGSTYEVTVDGESMGTASLERTDTRYRHGQPDRSGSPIPTDAIGRDPELRERFQIDRPDDVDPELDLEEMIPVAVAGERLYLRCRWGNTTQSIGAYHRWAGEELWHRQVDYPAEVAVVDDMEYLLDAGTLVATTVDGDERWRRDLHDEQYGDPDETVMVPTDDVLYVGTPDGVRVIDRASGDVRRTLEGTYAAVSSEAVFTWGDETVYGYERGSNEQLWETTLDIESTSVNSAGYQGEHVFVDHGVVSDGTVVVVSLVEDAEDTRYLADGFDVASGERRWRQTLARALQPSEEAARTDEPILTTGWGGEGPARKYPLITQPVVHNGIFYVGTLSGFQGYDLESGEERPRSVDAHGTYPTVANPLLVYFHGSEGLFAPVPKTDGKRQELTDPVVEVPGDAKFETTRPHHLFGRDAMYLLDDGYVNVISGTIPESGGSDDTADQTEDYPEDIVDRTGQDRVTVTVGPESGEYHFDPAGVLINPGTTVVWEWPTDTDTHQLYVSLPNGDDRESETVGEAGHTFEVTFESTGSYSCACVEHQERSIIEVVD